jgi:ATP-dependent Clp endopeptidase proteolytic subunit ClpP
MRRTRRVVWGPGLLVCGPLEGGEGIVIEDAVWTTAYINDLPDSAFLHIESGGTKDGDGKTTPRSLRYFPYRDKDGKIDVVHLRNAIAQAPKSNLPESVQKSVQEKARKLLEKENSASGLEETRMEASGRPTMWGLSVRGQGTDSLEFDIYDEIGGNFWTGGVMANDVRQAMKCSPNAKSITCRINSSGGEVFEGLAIYNLLKDHPAPVTVQVDAVAASMASLIVMSGDKRYMASNAFLMIHNPTGVEKGSAEDLRKMADVLDKATENLAQTYAARTGMPIEDVRAAMATETWYTADEAKAAGFIDEIVPAKKIAASSALRMFGKAPPGALALIASQEDPAAPEVQTPPPAVAGTTENESIGAPTAQGALTMNGVKVLLGLDAAAGEVDVMASINALKGRLLSFEQLTGKTGGEALGILQGWRDTAAKVPALEALVCDMQKKDAEREVDAMLFSATNPDALGYVKVLPAEKDQLRVAGLLNPGWLKGYLATRPSGPTASSGLQLGSNVRQPQNDSSSNNGEHVPTLNGKKFEDLEPYEKHNLRAQDEHSYQSLKADWARRGSPTKPIARVA